MKIWHMRGPLSGPTLANLRIMAAHGSDQFTLSVGATDLTGRADTDGICIRLPDGAMPMRWMPGPNGLYWAPAWRAIGRYVALVEIGL
jgi:hypothetical protein